MVVYFRIENFSKQVENFLRFCECGTSALERMNAKFT